MKNIISLREWCITNGFDNLLEEWDYEANDLEGFDIEKIRPRSNKKVNWKCKNGHKWKNSPDSRTSKLTPCPVCNGKKVVVGVNDLVTTHPDLAKEWNYSKNKNLTPRDVTRIHSKKVWWKCSVCCNEWEISVVSRTREGSGCPICARKLRGENRIKSTIKTKGYFNDPELLKDWDYELNFPKTNKDFSPSSNKKVHWECHVCGYKWKAKICNRVHGRGCPACSNKVVFKGFNDLATTHPEIAKEWHPTKNGSLTPSDVTYGQSTSVYWLCPSRHTYKATVNHRTGKDGTGCPICVSGRQTSFAEQAVYYYVKKEYPDAINRYKPQFLGKMELDIYIPSIKCAIEYDGAVWHTKEKLSREQRKYNICHKNGIKLIRLREEMAELGSEIADVQFGNSLDLYKHENLTIVIRQLMQYVTFKPIYKIDVDVIRDEFEILNYKQDLKNYNLQSEYPDIASEWLQEKNGSLTPSMVYPHVITKAWWKCPECGNEYRSTIGSRTSGTGCPECGKKKMAKSQEKPVEMIDPETMVVVREFKSISEASENMKVNASNISVVCKGNTYRKKAGGYLWRYKK